MKRPSAVASVVFALLSSGIALAQGAIYDYSPTQSAILNTNYQVLQTKQGRLVVVRDGWFVFRNVTIPPGVTIRGVGTHPMIWLVAGDMRIDGELSASGFDGEAVDTLDSANVPSFGGIGGAAGGFGGAGSPRTTARSPGGQDGFGPFQIPGFGGKGGVSLLGFTTGHWAAGGGGGVFATAGDPWWQVTQPKSPQELGRGGSGQDPSGPVPGGAPGSPIFLDGSAHNDFWGIGYDVNRGRFVFGELPFPIGGSGGAGGGDRFRTPTQNFVLDEKGGGGGGAGGALLIFAFGKVVVGPTGRVRADGGRGGGGEDAGSCRQGGGGGGGAGGLVLLGSPNLVELHVKGETYANRDSDFVVSADGGIGANSGFGRPSRMNKYPGGTTGSVNSGGFGGMGIVQFLIRHGTNQDGTNTILDDGIRLYRNGTLLAGKDKQRYLAWRGWPNKNGVLVDDSGRPTNVGQEGDIRPSPILLPIF